MVKSQGKNYETVQRRTVLPWGHDGSYMREKSLEIGGATIVGEVEIINLKSRTKKNGKKSKYKKKKNDTCLDDM